MKLNIKYIALLVIFSLVVIFAYQTYWLVNLYMEQTEKMRQDIHEALRISDYEEMMSRVKRYQSMRNVKHGNMEVSVGMKYAERKSGNIVERADTLKVKRERDAQPQNKMSKAFEGSVEIKDFVVYIQRGMHSGLDEISKADVRNVDKLLTKHLQRLGIKSEHCLLYLHKRNAADSLFISADTLAVVGKLPEGKADCYDYAVDLTKAYGYRLLVEPVTLVVVKQMTGILVASLVILLVLGFAFYYLVRVIYRQKSLDEMKSDFVNNMTHELKTPIAVAYAANDALLHFDTGNTEKKRYEYLQIGQEQLQRLGGLVEQILSMSMEKRSGMLLQMEDVRVKDLVVQAVEQQKLKTTKQMDVLIKMEDALMLHADRSHLFNIITNLLDNAVKYSGDSVKVEICGKENEISVTDNGVGIPKEKAQLIFDKFYRIPNGNLHDVKGYGLGLYYVKSMMEKFGGSVVVESEMGQGSCFRLLFKK